MNATEGQEGGMVAWLRVGDYRGAAVMRIDVCRYPVGTVAITASADLRPDLIPLVLKAASKGMTLGTTLHHSDGKWWMYACPTIRVCSALVESAGARIQDIEVPELFGEPAYGYRIGVLP